MSGTIVDVPGIAVGQDQDAIALTGCSVVLLGRDGGIAGVDVRGGAPGTRETDLLAPVNSAERIHAICLTGGSAYGLDAAGGVMRALEERGIGYRVRDVLVPLVPAAVIFDLGIGDAKRRPDAAMGYRCVELASSDPPIEGNAGAGCGATVGKVLGLDRAMKSGIGSASVRNKQGVVVGAIVVVNAVGSVIDPSSGKILAGPRNEAGAAVDAAAVLRERGWNREPPIATNTTIGVVATNAALTKTQATKVAQMAHNGLARTISPAHTSRDGDTLFAVCVGNVQTASDVVGALAVEAVMAAVLRAVTQAHGAGGLPAYCDLK
ncbi:MAG TPA: P1 family peptidase [Candidatus Binatia bacterium]|nr:P1 family peptidase [Candidatus Binatia bacterium]